MALHGGSAVMHRGVRHYDKLAWLITLGREAQLRSRFLDITRLQPGEAVLDVGCGTGTLALAAKARVGVNGRVHGIDASEEMIALAREKAKGSGADIGFETARAEQLPFADGSFDVVLSTLKRAVRINTRLRSSR